MPCSTYQGILASHDLSVGYKESCIVEGISFDLREGDVLAVVGHNGSGKSTFIKTLLGVISKVSGEIIWNNTKLANVAYLGQLTEFDHRFPVRVKDIATMGSWHGVGFMGTINSKHKKAVYDALVRAGIDHIAHQPIHELSAGQLQRALFARTIVRDASLILLDEPFAAVDQITQDKLLSLIDAWAKEGRGVILVEHDLTTVLNHANKTLLLGNGKAQFGLPADVLNPKNLVDHGYMSARQADWVQSVANGHKVGGYNNRV